MRTSIVRFTGLIMAWMASSTGCLGGSTDATEDASSELADLDEANMDHASRVEAAATLADVDAEEARFADVVGGHMGRMRGDASEMQGCGMMGGDMMDMDGFRTSLDQMEGMCTSHREVMAGMATLPDAKEEERHHAKRMREALDRTDTQLTGMMEAGACH